MSLATSLPDLANAAPPSLREVVLVRPRGFCAGVERAIAIVERALERYGAPVYVKHAIVHNQQVVSGLQARGAVFVEELDRIPRGSRVIFSAHGTSPQVRRQAEKLGLRVVDATCPLVTKVHLEAQRFRQAEYSILLIGHADHVEVMGTRGHAPEHITVVGDIAEAKRVQVKHPERVAYLTQTTLSVDDTRAIVAVLKRRFPSLRGPGQDDICYATQNRQNAVQELVKQTDLVLVLGSTHSSNSKRLVEVARSRGVAAYLIDTHHQLAPEWLEGVARVGVTAGASAPESVVQALVSYLTKTYRASLRELEIISERVAFPLPRELR